MRFNHLPPIYFLHIPRTGGTSLRYWLCELFGEQDWLDAHRYADLLPVNEGALRSHDLFSGHFGYEFAQTVRAAKPDLAVVSWLRDPVARQLSSFRFAAARQGSPADAKKWDPIQVLNSPGYSTHGANYQLRHLTRIWRIEEDGITVEPEKRVLNNEDLALAKRHLEELDTFGITEEMDRSIAVFSHHFRLPLLPTPKRLNTTRREDGDPRLEGARELIAQRNELDCALYSYARGLLSQRYDAMLDRYGIGAGSVEEQMAALRPHLLTRFLAAKTNSAQQARGVLDMSAGFFADGLGPRFYRRTYGRWLRWAGESRECVLYLPCGEGGALDLSFEIIVARSGRMLKELTLSVDGVPLRTSVDFRLSHIKVHAMLPGHLRRSGYTPVRMEVPEVSKPVGERPSRSICLSRIEIEPIEGEKRNIRPAHLVSLLGRLRAGTESTIMAARDNLANYVRLLQNHS